MSTLAWVIIIHLIEIVTIAGFFLIRKNNKLEQIVVDQQQYIDAISIIIQNSENTIRELDSRGAFESDDEVGTFFRNLQEIQEVLNQFNTRKN